MEADMIIGIGVLLISLAAIVALVLWSTRSIERIDATGFDSGRHMVKGFDKRVTRGDK